MRENLQLYLLHILNKSEGLSFYRDRITVSTHDFYNIFAGIQIPIHAELLSLYDFTYNLNGHGTKPRDELLSSETLPTHC